MFFAKNQMLIEIRENCKTFTEC